MIFLEPSGYTFSLFADIIGTDKHGSYHSRHNAQQRRSLTAARDGKPHLSTDLICIFPRCSHSRVLATIVLELWKQRLRSRKSEIANCCPVIQKMSRIRTTPVLDNSSKYLSPAFIPSLVVILKMPTSAFLNASFACNALPLMD